MKLLLWRVRGRVFAVLDSLPDKVGITLALVSALLHDVAGCCCTRSLAANGDEQSSTDSRMSISVFNSCVIAFVLFPAVRIH